MFLSSLHIKSFRGIHDLKLDLDEITVLVGSNNTGKTSILDALQACLSRTLTRRAGVFSDYDYQLPDKSAQPQDNKFGK
jgi:putative ATP-dependent endonuclease of the OLD family